jgi:hypothetical protein
MPKYGEETSLPEGQYQMSLWKPNELANFP